MNSRIFDIAPRAGFNVSSDESGARESSNSEFSELHEHRVFELSIANYTEERNGITFTNDFKSAVKGFPLKYDSNDPENRKKFERFFNRFGHFVVSSAYIGGAIEVKGTENELTDNNGTQKAISGSLGGKVAGIGGEASGSLTSSSTSRLQSSHTQKKFSYFGGLRTLHSEDIFDSEEKQLQWRTSLLVEPAVLDTERSLEPISTVIGCTDDKKTETSLDALEDLLEGKFLEAKGREKEEEGKEQKRGKGWKNLLRSESNTRLGSIFEPSIEDWWWTLKRTGKWLGLGYVGAALGLGFGGPVGAVVGGAVFLAAGYFLGDDSD